MQRKYIPTVVMLSAGAVTCIVSIVNKLDVLFSLEILLGVLIVFYVIGIIAKNIISKVLDSVIIPSEGEEESRESQEPALEEETDEDTEGGEKSGEEEETGEDF